MDRIRALKLLQQVRERRSRAFEDAVKEAVARSEGARHEVRLAQQALVEAVAAETRQRDRMLSMTEAGQTFDVQSLMLREHVAETLKGAVVVKQQCVEQCDAVLGQALQEVATRRGAMARHQRKLEALGKDIDQLLARREQEDDDRQDEEAEEVAIGRLARRAAPEAEGAAGDRP